MTVPSPVVPLLVPDLPDRHALLPYLERMDAARQYSNFGPLNRELEETLAALFSQRSGAEVHVTTVSSATLGLELALASLQLAPGSRVLLPALTFIATATVVIRCGLVPVVADVDRDSWLLTPAIAETALARQAFEAVLPVASFGQGQDTRAWQAFSAAHRIPVVIDAAAAFGSQWAAPPSADSDLTIVFSLHTTKSLPAGEGGLVVSTDPSRIGRVRQQSNFGINLDPGADVPVGMADVPGTNAKLSEYHAAVGLASLARWPERAAVRSALMQRYVQALVRASAGALVQQGPQPIAAPTLLCLRWPVPGLADELESECARAGVMTRRWYQPLLHLHPVVAEKALRLPTPVADHLAGELIGLPFFPSMTDAQVDAVVGCVSRVARARR